MFPLKPPCETARVDDRRKPLALRLWLFGAVVALGSSLGGCRRADTEGPRQGGTVAASSDSSDSKPNTPKATVRVVHYWDGSVGLVHLDGSSTIAAWPTQMRDDGGFVPASMRCERIAQGAPHIGQPLRAGSELPRFDELRTTRYLELHRVALERGDPCTSEFGSGWRVPALDEFNTYAPQLARPGSWIVRMPSGELSLVDYAPAIELRLARRVNIPARTRPSLADTARLFCLKSAPGVAEPAVPSREETERCVRQFFAPHGESTVELPEAGLSHLLAVRLACREAASDNDWLAIVNGLESKIRSLIEALTDPNLREVAGDEKTEDFILALFGSIRLCLGRTREASARPAAGAVERLNELEALLDSAHEQRRELIQRRRVLDAWQSMPEPFPKPAPEAKPKPKRCGCPQSDLACNMRCSAKGQ